MVAKLGKFDIIIIILLLLTSLNISAKYLSYDDRKQIAKIVAFTEVIQYEASNNFSGVGYYKSKNNHDELLNLASDSILRKAVLDDYNKVNQDRISRIKIDSINDGLGYTAYKDMFSIFEIQTSLDREVLNFVIAIDSYGNNYCLQGCTRTPYISDDDFGKQEFQRLYKHCFINTEQDSNQLFIAKVYLKYFEDSNLSNFSFKENVKELQKYYKNITEPNYSNSSDTNMLLYHIRDDFFSDKIIDVDLYSFHFTYDSLQVNYKTVHKFHKE